MPPGHHPQLGEATGVAPVICDFMTKAARRPQRAAQQLAETGAEC